MAIGWLAAATIGSSIINGVMQSNAASSAAQSQQQAAQYQANLSSNIYTANQVANLPSRELGGLAQQQEAYLLGLTPNLNISPDYSVANINPNLSGPGGISYTGPGGSDVSSTYGIGTPPAQTYTAPGASGPSPGAAVRPGVTGAGQSPGGLVPGPNGSMIPGGGVQLSPGGSSTGAPLGTAANPPFYSGPNTPQTGVPQGPSNANAGSINPLTGTPNTGAAGGGYGSLMNPYNPSTFMLSPDYNFLMGQGSAAINRAAAAGGQSGSTAEQQNLIGYSSGLAKTDYNNAFSNSLAAQGQEFNMLQGAITGGQVGTQSTVGAGTSANSAVGSAATGYGNAGAAGSIGQGNAWSSALNGGVNNATSLTLAANNPNSPFYQGSPPASYIPSAPAPITSTSSPGYIPANG